MDRSETNGRLNRAARSAAAIFFEEIPAEKEAEPWPPDIYDRPRLEIITDELDARLREGVPFVGWLILTVGEKTSVARDLASELARRSAIARGDSFAAVVLDSSFPRSRRRRPSSAIELREYDSIYDAAEAGARRLVVVDAAERANREKLGESRVGAVIAISRDALDGAYSRLLEDELKGRYPEATIHVRAASELAAVGRPESSERSVRRARRTTNAGVNRMADSLLIALNEQAEQI